MNEIIKLFIEIMTPAIQQFLVGVIGILLIWIGKKVGTILDTRTEREIAATVVQAMDMLGSKLGWTGAEKKAEALKRLSEALAAKKIKITATELDSLIESMVKNFKYGYGPVPAAIPTENTSDSQ